jgi:hypothetical protein
MHHKRKRARNRRAGCKMCKPWKVNGFATEREDGEKFTDHKRRMFATEDVSQYLIASTITPEEDFE